MWLAVAYQRLGDEEKANAMIAEYRKAVLTFTIAGWTKIFATNNVIVAEQRKSIETALRRLVLEIASVEAEHQNSRSTDGSERVRRSAGPPKMQRPLAPTRARSGKYARLHPLSVASEVYL